MSSNLLCAAIGLLAGFTAGLWFRPLSDWLRLRDYDREKQSAANRIAASID